MSGSRCAVVEQDRRPVEVAVFTDGNLSPVGHRHDSFHDRCPHEEILDYSPRAVAHVGEIRMPAMEGAPIRLYGE
ncbi:hypothetical protein KRMM14A1004_56480 [Krasilnikovia sp. MM14-A1004]